MSATTYKITVHHPTSQKSWELELPGSTTPTAIVNELIADGHLPRQPQNYELMVKGGALLDMDKPLEANKDIPQDAHVVVVPASKGGGRGVCRAPAGAGDAP